MPKSTYDQIDDGEWVDWHHHVDLACCDCGLVHEIKTRVKDGILQLQFRRNDRSTGQIRRATKRRKKVASKE